MFGSDFGLEVEDQTFRFTVERLWDTGVLRVGWNPFFVLSSTLTDNLSRLGAGDRSFPSWFQKVHLSLHVPPRSTALLEGKGDPTSLRSPLKVNDYFVSLEDPCIVRISSRPPIPKSSYRFV